MGILTIINAVGAVLGIASGLIPNLIAIKNALGQSGANFTSTIMTLEGDIVTVTGNTIADVDTWNAAHPV